MVTEPETTAKTTTILLTTVNITDNAKAIPTGPPTYHVESLVIDPKTTTKPTTILPTSVNSTEATQVMPLGQLLSCHVGSLASPCKNMLKCNEDPTYAPVTKKN